VTEDDLGFGGGVLVGVLVGALLVLRVLKLLLGYLAERRERAFLDDERPWGHEDSPGPPPDPGNPVP
jgi:hypothetical protein